MYVAAAIALLALAPQTARTVLVSAASVLLECLPYLAAATLLTPLLGRVSRSAIAFVGCGCGRAPGALSIPAAVATALLFGPLVACARFGAALVAWRRTTVRDHETTLLDELEGLVPSALLCGAVTVVLPSMHLAHAPPFVLFLFGAAIGMLATPCALGGVALASAFHASVPFLSYGVLCTSGIIAPRLPHLVIGLRNRCMAARGGTHPSAPHVPNRPLRARVRVPRVALPAALAFAVIAGAPMPGVIASETTLTDLYPGERLTFTGSYESGALVRYAITCCRADAAPVVIRLDRPLRMHERTWVRVDGIVARKDTSLVLAAQRAQSVVPPTDPFMYR